MARDRRLTADFRVSEAPCWWESSEEQADRLQETAARVLQPSRNVFGPIQVTSWTHWSDCSPRTGAHAHGGTVDVVPLKADTREVWEWMAVHLVPSGYIGRLIYEPTTPDQNEHIHIAPREDMVAAHGDARIQVLEELPDGSYRLFFDDTPGGPIPIPGLTVTAPAPGLFGFLGALLAGILLAPERRRAAS